MNKILPAYFYSQDPANIVEHQQLKELGCRQCDHAVSALNRWYCSNDRAVKFHKKVPHIGPSCTFYKLKR